MKQLILILILLASISVKAQDRQLYVEITDTIETAYHTYYDGWTEGFKMKFAKDSIGVDSVRIKRMYYIKHKDTYAITREGDSIPSYTIHKVYLDYEEREYPNGKTSRRTYPTMY